MNQLEVVSKGQSIYFRRLVVLLRAKEGFILKWEYYYFII